MKIVRGEIHCKTCQCWAYVYVVTSMTDMAAPKKPEWEQALDSELYKIKNWLKEKEAKCLKNL